MSKIKIILLFSVFSLPLIFELRVQATFLADYVAPETEEIEQRRTVGSGSRSDCNTKIDKNSVSLLVPKEKVVHYTSLEKPTFYLISRELLGTNTSNNFEFTLVDPFEGKTLVEERISVSEGIQEIELPKSIQLQLDKIYFWSVAIPCDGNSYDYRAVLEAAVKRIEPNQEVQFQLEEAKNDLRTASIYAQNGFWYDAVEFAVKDRSQDRKDNKIKHSDYLERLLQNIGLK